MKQYLIKLLTIFVVPLTTLLCVYALFLTDTHFNHQYAYRIVQVTGHWPIYATFAHALMSQRLIFIIGLIITAFLLAFRRIRNGGLPSRTICAVLVAFVAYIDLWWLQWSRIHPSLNNPFYPGLIRACIFAILAAAISVLAGLAMKRLWK